MFDERRRSERIRLLEPLKGKVDDLDVLVLEVGLLGGRIEHERPLPVGALIRLDFQWSDEELSLIAKIARSDIDSILTAAAGTPVYQSGLEFDEFLDRTEGLLKRLIHSHVTRALQEQESNAKGEGADLRQNIPFLRDLGITEKVNGEAPTSFESMRERIFVRHMMVAPGRWTEDVVAKPIHPREGFTILGSVDPDEIATLRRMYETSDENNRKLLRVMAELTFHSASADNVPQQRFEP